MLIISLIVFLPLLTVSTITSYRLRRIHGRKAGNQLSVKVRLVQLTLSGEVSLSVFTMQNEEQ
ncbi:hypothetical protein [Bacillus sp. 522_BSPC]|uniref:hypothetical protein n=1 Tax=Bacillus sp. 522_BSPC TaxID=1579338 RepID=UPI000AFD32B9|nr:hypothetical protein [Bacillus sp. 522_BSPC]